MYKKMTVSQLRSMKTGCFHTISKVMKQEGYPYFKHLIKKATDIGHTATYFQRSTPILRIRHHEGQTTLYDEREKIEITLTEEEIKTLHSMLKNTKKIDRLMKGKKSIMDGLRDIFQEGGHRTINEKPYLVYDIETTFATKNLREAKRIIAYAISTEKEKCGFSYIGPTSYKKFFKHLLDFDGYIIGYNNISFDNPVTAYNAGGTDEEIEILNKKSIDPFLFLYHMTGKKM